MAYTKFKQKFKEFFDKDLKTIDEGLDRRMRQINEFETNISVYYKNVECFAQESESNRQTNLRFDCAKRVARADTQVVLQRHPLRVSIEHSPGRSYIISVDTILKRTSSFKEQNK